MNFDLIFALIFYGLLVLFYIKNKKKFSKEGLLLLYRTKLGLLLMDKLAKKYPKLLNFLGYFSVFIGFIGMLSIFYILIKGTYGLIFVPDSAPVLAPVLPGISIPGLPVLSFWHWIIAIFFVAVIHEFAHGVYARLYNIKIKSSGFAFLGPILAAFVEPDEKIMKKASNKKQLTIISAGPFINIVLGFLFLLFFIFIFLPLQSNLFVVDGVNIVNVEQNSPAALSGLTSGTLITQINNEEVLDQGRLVTVIQDSNGESVNFITDKGEFEVKPEFKNDKYYVGVSVTNNVVVKSNIPEFILPLVKWFNMLIYWLWVISLGIGLFNLLPLGPIDGGRMFYVAMLSFFNDRKAMQIFKVVSFISLTLIVINLLPYLLKLFKWIINLF